MNRRSIALGAAAVLLASVGLYVGLRDGDTDADASLPRDRKISESGAGTPRATAPVLPRAGDTPVPPQGSAREYAVGGVRIRDHRRGSHPPVDVPPAVHPPQGRKIASQLTSDLAQKLRAVMAGCSTDVPAEARGATPRVEGEIKIAIKEKQATITSATFQPRDITGNAVDAIRQCLHGKAIGMTTPSGDEPDLESYAITLSLRVP